MAPSPSRLAPVRRRVRAFKIGFALLAAAAFGAAVQLARDAHPGAAATAGSRPLATPARLQQEASGTFFGSPSGGTIGSTSAAPQVQTGTS